VKQHPLGRREFLATAAAMGAALAWPAGIARASRVRWTERRDLYPEGVASGDPAADSVVLWTRRPAATGKPASWLTAEIAEDEAFARVVSTTKVQPIADNDWTVRVLAAGLKPATVYWYRFTDEAGFGSRIGRTITAPAADDPRPISFTFVSCQNENLGYNNAYRRMMFDDAQKPRAEQLGFVLHLGDFFYELVWYPEDKATYYARKVRDIVRYPNTEKHEDFHVPVKVEDYRAIFRAYLSDPDLADARARWPFVCIWDNHEFSWQGWQTLVDYGAGTMPAQTRKVAAAQAWFEYQPARVKKADADWNSFTAPQVKDTPVTSFDENGLGQEPNNLAAIGALTLYRTLRYGKNVDLIITDNRSYRSKDPTDTPETDPLGDKNFPGLAPMDALEIIDAGRTYNDGKPPAVIRFAGKDIPNWRKDKPPPSILGAAQKQWFLQQLRDSKAAWKLWGNTIGSLDARVDTQNLPKDAAAHWPGDGYATLTGGDWAGYRTERGEILDFVKAQRIGGFASLAGDRHAFWAGLLSKDLPPNIYEPVAIEFVTGSISAPGYAEKMEYQLPKDSPMRALYLQPAPNGALLRTLNLTTMHGVMASLTLAKTGDQKSALAASNAEVAPHLSFIDWGGHGFVVVRASSDALDVEFVGIQRPVARSEAADGGPLAYRVRHTAKLWQGGEAPKLEQTVLEGTPPLST
jgi:alkaline phosphatase D